MKVYLIFYLLVGYASMLLGQNHVVEYKNLIDDNPDPAASDEIGLYQYSIGIDTFLPARVASDFGPRRTGAIASGCNNYNWHGGVDFNSGNASNSDLGDLLVSQTAGTLIGNLASNYKRVFVNGDDEINDVPFDFGYGHIFKDDIGIPQASGSCMLVGPSEVNGETVSRMG